MMHVYIYAWDPDLACFCYADCIYNVSYIIHMSMAGQYLKYHVATEMVRMHMKRCALSPSMACLLYTSPSPRDATLSRMPSSA